MPKIKFVSTSQRAMMDAIDELDVIRLKDGREGVVMALWTADGQAYEVEFDFSAGSDVQTVAASEIECIVEKHRNGA